MRPSKNVRDQRLIRAAQRSKDTMMYRTQGKAVKGQKYWKSNN